MLRRIMTALVCGAAVVATGSASADLGDELAKILPNDGEASEEFGFSVAISGTTAIIGAWHDDDNGKNAGSAYIFDISDPSNPVQTVKLLPEDGDPGDMLGRSVALDGDTAIVGSSENDDNGDNSGTAYVFDTVTGEQRFRLSPADPDRQHYFGTSVAVVGNTVFVGAHGDDEVARNAGAVYVFDATTGEQLAKILVSDGEPSDSFGESVAVSGTTLVVGADRYSYWGAAYVFDVSDPTNPVRTARLVPYDREVDDRVGAAVAISGTVALVGAPWADDNGNMSGAAYLFDTILGPTNRQTPSRRWTSSRAFWQDRLRSPRASRSSLRKSFRPAPPTSLKL